MHVTSWLDSLRSGFVTSPTARVRRRRANSAANVAYAQVQLLEARVLLTASFTITESAGSTSVSEHGSALQKTDSFDVVLDVAPASNVVLNITSNDPGEATVNVATLTFTPGNWNVAQTVTVAGVFDNLTDGNQNTSITVSVDDGLSDDAYDGVADQNVAVAVEDVANRPVVVAPSGAGQTNPVTFQWNGDDVMGETSFALWLINKGTGTLVYENAALAADSTSFELPLTLDPGEYRFWMNSVSANGYSQSGAPTDFTVGAALVPPTPPTGFFTSDSGNPSRPQINWSSVGGADTYGIYLINLVTNTLVASQTGLTNNFFVPTSDLAPGTYRIWVNASNAAGTSPWSVPFDFRRAFEVSPPVGGEFQVNTFTMFNQQTFLVSPQSVAMDAEGDFVVTWTSSNQDGGFDGVYAQRYNAAGIAQGGEFRVNTFTTDNQRYSTVAMDADGDFVITWTSYGQDGSGDGVYAQGYSAAGLPQGSEFQVNTFTTGRQQFSTVAMDADGDFVITWTSRNQDGSDYGVYAQRYNAAGLAQGSEFRVNTFTTGNQAYSTVAMDAAGNFVVTWSSYGQDGDDYGVYAQRYNAAGLTQGSEFRVNTFTTDWQVYSTVAMDADGDFVVTWTSGYSVGVGQDGSRYGIYAQRYNAAGLAQGSEFQVNTFTTGNQHSSRVAMDADGDFVVTWGSFLQDGSAFSVFAQRYNAAGLAQGSEFHVNTYTTGIQIFSAVAMDADGDFVVTWSSNGQDGGGYGVYAQRYGFGVATLVLPAAPTGLFTSDSGNPNRPQINWGSVSGADSYGVYLINLATNSVVVSQTGLGTNSFVPTSDLAAGRYRIWANAKNGAGTSPWSTPFDFDVGTPLMMPTVPTGFSASNTNTTTPTVTWMAQPAGTKYAIWFINLDTNTLVSGETNLITAAYTPSSPLVNGHYRIWVRAYNSLGSSGWSSPFDFTVAA